MKNCVGIILLMFVLLSSDLLWAQQITVFHEDFSVPDSINTSAPPSWFLNPAYYTSAPSCYRDTVPAGVAGTNNYFTTNAFDCSGQGYVAIDFSHICKIPPSQRATIEVSVNGAGGPWIILDSIQYRTNFYHPGQSLYFGRNGENHFSSLSYPSAWNPGSHTAFPDSSWWRKEIFDISALAANQADVRLRFKLTNYDGNGSLTREYGWLIDDLHVQIAPTEPPAISLISTNAGTFTLGPFHLLVSIPTTGITCCNNGFMYYSVNGGAYNTVGLAPIVNDLWTCTIPPVNELDTICYFFQAFNYADVEGYLPPQFLPYSSPADAFIAGGGTNCFVASRGIPYYDNFTDVPGLWYSDTVQPGSDWELGNPIVGVTTGSYSAPSCWDIDLDQRYVSNSHAFLYSPTFTLTYGITDNLKLSFWRNQYVQSGRDGFRLQYDMNGLGVWTTLGYKGDPRATNWYDTTIVGSIPPYQDTWSGNTGTWIESTIYLTQFIGFTGTLRFRFVFDSDNFGNLDGVSIDNFSLVVPPAKDLTLTAILNPVNSRPSGVADSVTVRIRNIGSKVQRNFNLGYRNFSSGHIVTEPFPAGDSIMVAEERIFIFATTDLVPQGAYNICTYVSLAGDIDRTNDTLCFGTIGVTTESLPYVDYFDSGNIYWSDSTSSGPLTNWELGTPNYRSTTGAYSSPNAWDINLNGPYAHEASCFLLSPFFDFTNKRDVTMRFWQNRNLTYGEDGFRIEYTTTGGIFDWQTLDTAGNTESENWYNDSFIWASARPGWTGNSFGWKESKIVLKQLDSAGSTVRFRFVFSSYLNAIADGVSIDNFSLKAASLLDATPVAILSPEQQGIRGNTDHVTVVIKNVGLNTLTSRSIAYSINGVQSAIENWTGSLPTYGTDTFTFASTYIVPMADYELCVYLIGIDGDPTNDTLCRVIHALPRVPLPYNDSFDGITDDWYSVSVDNITTWERGSPAYGATNSSHSAPDAWDINLTTPYNESANTILYSPVFDMTNIFSPRLSFWQNRNTESARDGVRMEFSIDGGHTWETLDTSANLFSGNWYNDTFITSSQKPAWSGNSSGWLQSKMVLTQFQNPGPDVQFRFIFTSDLAGNAAGFSMDDFSIAPSPAHDAAGIALSYPLPVNEIGIADSIRVIIRNLGSQSLTNMNITYSINASAPVTMSWIGNLLPGESSIAALDTIHLIAGSSRICFYTDEVSDGDHSNDTVCSDFFSYNLFQLPYTDNFNTLPMGWYVQSERAGTDWEWGSPVYGQTTGSHSSPACWDLNLNSAYQDDAICYLVSPAFDFNLPHGELSFWQNRNCEFFYDGLKMDLSVDLGKTWTPLGVYHDQNAINWYNRQDLNFSNAPAWDSVSLDINGNVGWQQSTYLNLPSSTYYKKVMFRFAFTSDASTQWDGISIDDFSVYVYPVGIEPIGIQATLNIYPNPGNGQFFMESGTKNVDGQMTVTDILGKEILKKSVKNLQRETLDLTAQPDGVYILTIRTPDFTLSRKLIICK